jgi:hypothetical protein
MEGDDKNGGTHALLREFINTIINENNKRRDEERRIEDIKHHQDDLSALKERIAADSAALEKALVLQAGAYPTVKDFNELEKLVRVELASRSGGSATITVLFQVITALNMVIGVVLAILLYSK